MAAPPEGTAIRMPGGDGELSDEEMIARAQRDPEHFAPLYARYARPIHAFVLRRTGDPEQAADITSQVFTRALAALPRYRHGPFRGWLYAIARNILIDAHRRAKHILPLERVELVPTTARSPEDEAIASEAQTTLMAALDRLTTTQRKIVLLRLQGLTGQEIADELEMGYAAMKSAQYRAFGRLRHYLGASNLDLSDSPRPRNKEQHHDTR